MINVIALLDKSDPPEHSFVDGFLSTLLPEQDGVRVRLIVSRSGKGASRSPHRYRRAVCLPKLYRRRSLGRFANLFQSLKLLIPQIMILRRRGEVVILLVRNCPVLLLAAAMVSPFVDRLVYQSSFPHERASGGPVMRWGARLMMRICRGRVQGVLAVSPLGLARVRRLFPNVDAAAWVPLLADVPEEVVASRCPETGTIRSIYVGSHEPRRGVEMVLRAAAMVLDRGLDVEFRFVGCTDAQRQRLASDQIVREWLDRGRIRLIAPIPRHQIWGELSACQVGLSLIPPWPEYREAFPTKLVEYMGIGLAVLGSRGIPAQEDLIEASQSGVLVDWQVASIADGMARMVADRDGLARRQHQARVFAAQELTPRRHLATLERVLRGPAGLAGSYRTEVSPRLSTTTATSDLSGDGDD